MNIKEVFLLLTNRTYPHGLESKLKKFLPKDIQKDKHGNYFYQIGISKTIFTCHLDTVCKKYQRINQVIDGDFIRSDGKTNLGADDKAGMCVLLYMIEQNIPGLYYFFIGEEVGCIGSKAASNDEHFSNYDRIISFDRKATNSVITHQSWLRCCSDSFAEALCDEYNKLGFEFKSDNTGVKTDSAQFTEIIPECTNISVGYYKEHTNEEYQDIVFLEKLCLASSLIDWENLPTERNPKEVEYREYISEYHSNKILDKVYGYGVLTEPKLNLTTFDKNDSFFVFKNYLSNRHITAEEYGIIEEQFIRFC